jgi:hypothetical protein
MSFMHANESRGDLMVVQAVYEKMALEVAYAI